MRRLLKDKGFTLIEMAIVLVIVGLLVARFLVPLGAQRDIRDYAETRAELSEYKEALVGYALSQTPPYLPCPDTDNDGFEENRNAANNCVNAANIEITAGGVPWATLGLRAQDSWNNTYLYSVTAGFSNSGGFTLGTAGDNTIFDAAVGGNTVAANIPVVIISKGKNGAGGGGDESENDTTDTVFVSHEQIDIAANQFDDVVVWLPATILFNRMVAAGKLP